ncbi:hypothetical protein FJTKL_09855 [Diaporthe vaccinii]|uniref:Uncharacterized protein n=1 Tax=Diaporthe vaccinii TaxID=105482 RepID=A0ABR4EM65_9PEZI
MPDIGPDPSLSWRRGNGCQYRAKFPFEGIPCTPVSVELLPTHGPSLLLPWSALEAASPSRTTNAPRRICLFAVPHNPAFNCQVP